MYVLPFVGPVCWSTVTPNSKDQSLFREAVAGQILTLLWPAPAHCFCRNCQKVASLWSCAARGFPAAQEFSFAALQSTSAVCGGAEQGLLLLPGCMAACVRVLDVSSVLGRAGSVSCGTVVLPYMWRPQQALDCAARRFWHWQRICVFQEAQQLLSMWCPVLLHVHKYVWRVMKVKDLLCIPQIF